MKKINNILIQFLPIPFRKSVRRFLRNLLAFFYSFNLSRLAQIYRSDKWGVHYYTPHYQKHFSKFKFKKIKILEIGVGGYKNPDVGGNSLRMWKIFFPFGHIFSFDIEDKTKLQEKRITIFQGSQTDNEFLEKMINQIGQPHIIIDDGSHENAHVIHTFLSLFPKLLEGGIYVVEDTQCSYWPAYGGDSRDLKNQSTMMNFFKNLTDCLNHEEFLIPGYKKNYFDENIVSMHFYHNLIIVYKGKNIEPSNLIINNGIAQ